MLSFVKATSIYNKVPKSLIVALYILIYLIFVSGVMRSQLPLFLFIKPMTFVIFAYRIEKSHLKRVIHKSKKCIVGYHTQEYRPADQALEEPICCTDHTAWLGVGYYFWIDLTFAKYWGIDCKIGHSGAYDVYNAFIESDNLLNAVFDEEGYNFFVEKIEATIEHLKSVNAKHVTIGRVHRYLADNIWKELGVTGIIYDDLPKNVVDKNRVYSEIHPLYYKKRIQIIAFKLNIIHSFDVLLEAQEVA